jgi:hypothetical protein
MTSSGGRVGSDGGGLAAMFAQFVISLRLGHSNAIKTGRLDLAHLTAHCASSASEKGR